MDQGYACDWWAAGGPLAHGEITRNPFLAFLQRCRDTNTLPCCVEVKHHLNTKAARRILRRTSEALLRERVRHTRHSLHLCSEELLRIHLELGAKLNATDWDTIETITHDSSRNTETAVRETQIRKFEKLSDRQHPSSLGHGPEKDRSVINFTDYQLTNAHISILSKGLNFAIAPTKIPKEEIVTEVEYAIRKLPKGDADEIREDVARILRNARPPKMNITGAERRALSDLRGNENILILPADKGNSTVLMKRGDYEMKISRMLEDSTYRKLRSDPTAKAERDTRALIKNSTIPREHQTRLFPSAAKPPRLYGLPKVHKEGVPLRPIVSQIDGPTYRLSKYLAQSLQPYVGQTSSFVRDSTHFIEILKKITISPNDILVSFDVASLFTNVPIQESVDIIKELTKSGIPEDHPQLIEYCLRNSYFLWSGSFFEQREGAAMGSPLSPKQTRHDQSRETLFLLEQDKDDFIGRLVTADDYWIYQHGPETKDMSKEWKHSDSPPREKAKVQMSVEEVILPDFGTVEELTSEQTT
ncbi:uncharacterized protein [Hetaerina americana]|uniref:uncharacterized protein n=1 Tax=Hetaerina americana TaxID=62018 RepID=UPI003A7F2C47